MKCTKCGNELKEGIKFCPQCGEEIKEEKKIRYCTKCGAEMQPDSSFCAKCGTGVNVAQEQGATKKPKKQGGKAKKIFLIAGIVIVVLLSIGGIMLNSEKAMYKAYVKFHEEYRDKHAQYEEYNDCAARIIMSPENEKWLAIWDITYFDEDVRKEKITLYRYSWGKVKKVATATEKNMKYADDAVIFSVIDNELYLFKDTLGWDEDTDMMLRESEEEMLLESAYRLNGDKFEVVRAKGRKYKDSYEVYITDLDMPYWKFCFLGNFKDLGDYTEQIYVVNSVFSANVNEFEEVINELSKYKIKNQVDLQIAYGKILKEFGSFYDAFYDDLLSSEYPVVGTMKTEYGYYYVRTSGNVALADLNDAGEKVDLEDFYKAIKSADGRKVTGIADYSLFGNSLLNGQNLKIPDNITYIGAHVFENCNIEQIEIPDSVEKIGEDTFAGNSYGLFPVVIASEGSYTQKYAEKNNLDWSEKKLREDELEERKNIAEALRAYQTYINNYEAEYDGEEYRGVTFGYVNDDTIPECFVWKTYKNQAYDKGLTILSYMDGEIIVSDSFSAAYSLEEFTYTPRTGKVCGAAWVNGAGAMYMIYELTDKFETIAEVYDFMAGFEKDEKFTVNGEDYGSHEAIEEYISSLGLKDYFTEEDICENASEAYDNLKKAN